MLAYWLMFGLIAAASLNYRVRMDRRGAAGFALLGILVTLMIGLRFEVGGDWASYLRIYRDISYLDFWQALFESDPGYSLVNWISTRLDAGIGPVNLICAAIFALGLFKFAWHQPNPYLAVAVAFPYLIVVVAMGYTRQSVAIGLLMLGLASLDYGSLARFAAFAILATSFHKSAIIMLPLVLLGVARNRLMVIAVAALMLPALYFVLVRSSVDTLMTNYVDAQYSSSGAMVRLAMTLLPGVIYMRVGRRLAASPEQYVLWRNIALAAFAAFALLLATPSSTAVDRIALYLIPLQIFVFARLPEIQADARVGARIKLGVVAYSGLILFVYLSFGEYATYWKPYKVIGFFPETERSRWVGP